MFSNRHANEQTANILYAKYLARHLTSSHPKILANAIHPGFVDTKQTNQDIHEPYPLLGYGVSVALKPFRKTQFEGAVSACYAATTTKESGQYVCPPAIVEKGSELANDMDLAEQLMRLTKSVVEEKTRPDSSAKGCPFKMD